MHEDINSHPLPHATTQPQPLFPAPCVQLTPKSFCSFPHPFQRPTKISSLINMMMMMLLLLMMMTVMMMSEGGRMTIKWKKPCEEQKFQYEIGG